MRRTGTETDGEAQSRESGARIGRECGHADSINGRAFEFARTPT